MKQSAPTITRALADAFYARRAVFSDIDDLLEHQIPHGVEVGSAEHARFYFFLIFNDHGTKSSRLYAHFKQLYVTQPELFQPRDLARMAPAKVEQALAAALTGIGLRYPKQAITSWLANAQRLVREYDAEPLACFTHTSHAPTLFRSILNFRGYGPKTAGLLLRVIHGVGFNRKLDNLAEVPLPVDIHDSRIAFICHLYRPAGVHDVGVIHASPRHLAEVERMWRQAAHASQVPWEIIDRALWILGSRGCVKRRCHDCPIQRHCDIGREEVRNATPLFDDSPVQHKRQTENV